MGQPTDLRAYPPRFWEVLQRVSEGHTVTFTFPHTEDGRKRCHTLHMRLSAFRKLMRQADPTHQDELLITAAWDMALPKLSHWEFHAKPQETFEDELERALRPLED